MTSPNARNIVVTKSKYGPAARFGDEDVVREAQKEGDGVRQDDVGDADAEGEEDEREGDPRPDDAAARPASGPGETNAQAW